MRADTPEDPALRGPRSRTGGVLLRVLRQGRSRVAGLAWLPAWVPFTWRLALRRRLHAMLGTPMAPLPLPAARRRNLVASSPTTPGINLIGYARGEFGVAETLRGHARALEQAGYPFGILDLDVGPASRQTDHSMDSHCVDGLQHATNAFFLNADQLPIARSVLGRDAFSGHHNIGYWLWELERFPRDWYRAFDLVDEVWTPTAFVRDAIGAATRKPVLQMPMPIEFKTPTGMDRAHFGLPSDAFVFLFSFDFNGFAARKNPEAVIAAFRQAFDDGTRDVKLLVKSSNGARFPDRLAALQQLAAGDPRIEVRDGFLASDTMRGLQNACDCFVSLHRAEGFGLGLAECMYLGKPVVATGYSGNLDFMHQGNSLLVDYRLVRLRRGDYPYWQGQHWAEPDIAHAAHWLRRVFDDRELARRIGGEAASSIRRTHSLAVCAAAITARLQEIDRRRTTP